MNGGGLLTLSATNNSYTGATSVAAGILTVTNTGALPNYGAAKNVAVGNGGMLTLPVGGTGWTAGNISSLIVSNGTGFAAGAVLGIDTTNATGGFSYGTAIVGNMGLTKFGPNALILTGTNSYTGLTTVSGGTLQFGDGTAAMTAHSPPPRASPTTRPWSITSPARRPTPALSAALAA